MIAPRILLLPAKDRQNSETHRDICAQAAAGKLSHRDAPGQRFQGADTVRRKRSKTWCFQKDVGGQTRRVLFGCYPAISAKTARQAALEFTLEWGRGAGKRIQVGAPTLQSAMEAYLARPKLRSDTHKSGLRQQFELHLKDWLRLGPPI